MATNDLAQALQQILSSGSHAPGAKQVLQQMLQNNTFRKWFIANQQRLVNAAGAGTTNLDVVVLANAAFRLRGRMKIGQVANRLSQGLEQKGGYSGALNSVSPGLGGLLGSGPFKGYVPTIYATEGGGQAKGLPGGISKHDFNVFWGQANDIYETWLGRKATQQEAMKAFKSGVSWHGLQQQLIMSKQFVGTQKYKQMANYYNLMAHQFMGEGFHLKSKMIQSFTAQGFQEGDFQAFIYRHPKLYVQSNDYKNRYSQLASVAEQLLGYNPLMTQAGVNTTIVPPGTQPAPGAPPGQGTPPGQTPPPPPPAPGMARPIQGSGATPPDFRHTKTTPQAVGLLTTLQHAAMNFQTPDQFAAWMMQQPGYRSLILARTKGQQSQAGLSLSGFGRPVQASSRQGAAPDVAA